MSPSRENGIFDDVIITSSLHSDRWVNFESKVHVWLVKRIFGITCVENSKNTLEVVKKLFRENCGFFPYTVYKNVVLWFQCVVQKLFVCLYSLCFDVTTLCLKKTSPFLFLWYLSLSDFIRFCYFWQKHPQEILNKHMYTVRFISRFICSYCTL